MPDQHGSPPRLARRLAVLPRARAGGIEVPVATSYLARLLGLAFLRRERAGAGLLLPDCRGIHTLGMRFRLDVVFLDSEGDELRRARSVEPGLFVSSRGAVAILELPAAGDAGAASPSDRGEDAR